MMRRYDKTKYAYQAVASSDSLIFLLYDNGETISKDEDQDEASQFKTIVVIDWEGRPLSLYQLDHSIISVCVDWHRRVIYGLDRIESEVYAFVLSLRFMHFRSELTCRTSYWRLTCYQHLLRRCRRKLSRIEFIFFLKTNTFD